MIACETAYYEFDLSAVARRLRVLRQGLGDGIALAYAVKANPFLTEALAPLVERMEICSPGEWSVCQHCGVPEEMQVISGVYKTPAFIEQRIQNGAGQIITVESLTQWELLRRLSAQYHRPLRLLLRLTNDSQFGINPEEIAQIIASRREYPLLDILGIQFFSGTQKKSLKKLAREIAHLDALLLDLHTRFGYCARELEYGPGLPVAYFAGEELDEEALLHGLRALLDQMTAKPHITLELGRSIAASCGRYYSHVVDCKRNAGQNYLLLDGGMHQMVYFGQYMGMKQPKITLCGKEHLPCCESWNICGSLCSMNDILVKQLPLPEVCVGDTLCFHNTGAYCMTEGIALFLSRELPAVYLTEENGSARLVRPPVETAPWNTPGQL